MDNIEQLTADYEAQTGKKVPNRYKNDAEWIANKLATPETTEEVTQEEETTEEEIVIDGDFTAEVNPETANKLNGKTMTMNEFGSALLENTIIKPRSSLGLVLKKNVIHNHVIYQAGDVCPDGLNMTDLAKRGII